MIIPLQIWDVASNFDDLPDEDLVALWAEGSLHELWEGRLVQEEMTYPLHGVVANRIGYFLIAHLMQQQITVDVVQHTLFNVTQPGQQRTIPTFAPWLAIEILSPKQALAQMRIKCQAYFQAGTAEVWIVDPEQIFVDVITLSGTTTYMAQQHLRSSILPGLTLLVRSLIP